MNYRLVLEINKDKFNSLIQELKTITKYLLKDKKNFNTIVETSTTIFLDMKYYSYESDETIKNIETILTNYKQYCKIFIYGTTDQYLNQGDKLSWYVSNTTTDNFEIKSRLVFVEKTNYFEATGFTIIKLNEINYLKFKNNLFNDITIDMQSVDLFKVDVTNYRDEQQNYTLYYKNFPYNISELKDIMKNYPSSIASTFTKINDEIFYDLITSDKNSYDLINDEYKLLVDYTKLKQIKGFTKYDTKQSMYEYIQSIKEVK
jgi:hypothetical protein